MTVLALMATAALTFSYLGAYAVADTLVRADILSPWQPGPDPRPRWMCYGFLFCMSLSLMAAGLFLTASRRQLNRIDAMADD